MEEQRYLLVSVCDREFLTEQFTSLREAQDAMHQEMIEWGRVPREEFDGCETTEDSKETSDYGFGKWSAWANDGVNHANLDWLIVQIRGSLMR